METGPQQILYVPRSPRWGHVLAKIFSDIAVENTTNSVSVASFLFLLTITFVNMFQSLHGEAMMQQKVGHEVDICCADRSPGGSVTENRSREKSHPTSHLRDVVERDLIPRVSQLTVYRNATSDGRSGAGSSSTLGTVPRGRLSRCQRQCRSDGRPFPLIYHHK